MTIRPTPRSSLRSGGRRAPGPGPTLTVPQPQARSRGDSSRRPADAGPSAAILSLRDVRAMSDHSGLFEAEEALIECLDARLHRVVLASARYRRPPLRAPAVRRALSYSRVASPYRIQHHHDAEDPADVLLVLARDLADAAALVGLPDWYRLGQLVMMHVQAVSEQDLRRHPELVRLLRRQVDALFVGSEMPPLGFLRSPRLRTVEVVPALLDVLAFPYRSGRADRTIDVFSPGAHHPAQHQLLLSWANAHDGSYQHDMGQLGATTSLGQRRRVFTTMATRSRVFITNYTRLGRRRHTGDHREAGAAFYEAMAAGCVLAGDLPTGSRLFGSYVAAAGPLRFPVDATVLPTELADVLGDADACERLGAGSRAAALRHNDVAHRWRQMAGYAGVPVAPAIDARITQLGQLADRPDSGSTGDGNRDPALDGT